MFKKKKQRKKIDKGQLVNDLNNSLRSLSDLNGKSIRANMKLLAIPLNANKVQTKQLPGYISRVRETIRREHGKR